MKYFTIAELCNSQTAKKKGIKNIPSEIQEKNLIDLIENVLDPAREKYNKSVFVSSGFRCEALNKSVGGEKSSQHRSGKAADLYTKEGTKGNYELAKIIAGLNNFDQLILENVDKNNYPQWVHVSFNKGKNRHQILKKISGKGYFICTI